MSFAPPLKGSPRPAGLERTVERVSARPGVGCSMRPIGVCLGPEDAPVVLRIRIRERDRGQGWKGFHAYHLCETCALAGGDREVLERGPAPSGSEAEGTKKARAPRAPDASAARRRPPPEDGPVWEVESAAEE